MVSFYFLGGLSMKSENVLAVLKDTAVEKSPEICLGIGVASLISAGIMCVPATYKSTRILEGLRETRGDELTKKEIISNTYQYYIPSMLLVIGGVVCILCSSKLYNKKYAALAALYSLSKDEIAKHKDELTKLVGMDKAKEINNDIAEKVVKEVTASTNKSDSVCVIGNGDVLCIDSITGRPFYATLEDIRAAVNTLNDSMNKGEQFISVSQYWDELNKPELTHTDTSDYIGWDLYNEGVLDLKIESTIYNNKPALKIGWYNNPNYH